MAAGLGGLGLAATQVRDQMDPTWPPVLVALVLVVLIGGMVVVAMMFRRLRAAARGDRSGSGSRRR
jgi:hypothetical protein